MKMTMKTVRLAMAVLLLTAAAAIASPLVSGGDKGGDESMERDLASGIHVTLMGAFRVPGEDDSIWARFIVESQQDTEIKVDGEDLFDGNGNRYEYRGTPYIGNKVTRTRYIIGGVKTRVGFWYGVSKERGLPLFARMTFKFNDKELVFRNVQTQHWEQKKK